MVQTIHRAVMILLVLFVDMEYETVICYHLLFYDYYLLIYFLCNTVLLKYMNTSTYVKVLTATISS